MFEDQTIAFIGSGSMAEAMIRGLLNKKIVRPEQIIAAGPRPERGQQLQQRHAIQVTTNNTEAAEAGQIVILAVKPQALLTVVPEIRGHLRRRDLLLSILAGVPIKRLADSLAHAAVVRAMPNTPAQIGQGMTVWTATPEVEKNQLGQTQAILGSLGEEIHMDEEEYLDMATALSGTGPAYVFLFMEAMIDAGVHLGFSRRVATQLVFQTMRGTVEYAAQSGLHAAELRNQVTSPGGTTAEALYHIEHGGLRTILTRAIFAAHQRSISLGQGKKRPTLDL